MSRLISLRWSRERNGGSINADRMGNEFFPYANAICYSEYRPGKRPGAAYPAYGEVLEDLHILAPHWHYLRLYDCSPHAEIVLIVIRKEALPFKVMLGAYIDAEVNTHQCPWNRRIRLICVAAEPQGQRTGDSPAYQTGTAVQRYCHGRIGRKRGDC